MAEILILDSKTDAEIFKSKPFDVEKILCINPTARAAVNDMDKEIINTLETYPDTKHQKTIEYLYESKSLLEQALKANKLSQHTADSCTNLLFYLISCAAYLYQNTEGFSKYHWYEGSKLKSSDSHEQCFKALLNENYGQLAANKDFLKRSKLHDFILSKYNNYISRKYGSRKKILSLDGARPSAFKFMKIAKAIEPEILNFVAKQPGKNIFSSVRQALRSKKHLRQSRALNTRKDVPCFFFYVEESPITYSKARQIIDEISCSQPLKLWFDLVSDILAKNIVVSEGFAKSGAELTKKLNPQIVVTDAISSSLTSSVCEQVKNSGGKVVLFNHASHTPQANPENKKMANLWASHGIIYHPQATHNSLRSPEIGELAKEIYGDNVASSIVPLIHGRAIEKKPHDKFHIIFAGNYLPARHHVPQLVETPDEFAQSIINLAEAVSKIPEAKLTVKLKARKKECDEQAVKKLMTEYNNVEVKSTGSLREELKTCDLLVANLSTTIDEALESHIPVLLYTSHQRYSHYIGSNKPSEKISAVYNPPVDKPLEEFIQEIIVAHKASAPTKEHFKKYIWANKGIDMQEFVEKTLKS